MNKETAFSLGLPKWPQLRLTGPNVGEALAKEIIFATDVFLTSFGSSGGNNHAWENAVRTRMGVPRVDAPAHGTPEWEPYVKAQRAMFRLQAMWAEAGNVLSTEYLKNDWAACCWIGGPHGWCSPAGEIYFADNVGEDPSVESIYDDLVAIAEKWPAVVMVATLMSGESGSEEALPVVTMKAEGGVVTFLDYEPGDLNFQKAHYAPTRTVDVVAQFTARFNLGRGAEQGLPQAWVDEFADSVKAFVVAEEMVKWK